MPQLKRPVIVLLVVVTVIAVVAAVLFLWPQRSVAAYCRTYGQEKARLDRLPGKTYPSGAFNATVSDASQFARSLDRLRRVAPAEIESDLHTLQSLYQTIHDHPEQAITASLSGAQADEDVKQWTIQHCPDQWQAEP